MAFGDFAIFAQKRRFVFGIVDRGDFFVGEGDEGIPFFELEVESG